MSKLGDVLRSHMRIQAIAEVSGRYSAIIAGLTSAIDGVLDEDLPDEARHVLREAIIDAEVQLVAASDALHRALKDLPEGGGG